MKKGELTGAHRMISGKSTETRATARQTAKASQAERLHGISGAKAVGARDGHKGAYPQKALCRVGFVQSGPRKCHKSPAYVWEKMW